MAKKKPAVKPVPVKKPVEEPKKPVAEAKETVKAETAKATESKATESKAEATKSPTRDAKAGAERRAALRAQQEAIARRARRNRVLTVIGVIVLVAALVAGLIWWKVYGPGKADTETPKLTSTAAQITPPDGNSTDPGQQAWITVPSANTKPDALIVDINSDYQCPYCALVENTYAIPLEQLNAQGDIILRLHTRSFLDPVEKTQSSTRAAMAAACVDVADSSKYGEYNNTIYRNQPNEGKGFTDEQLTVAFTTAIGLTGDALATFNKCYSDRATLSWVQNVEKNNHDPVVNQNPPYKYLYGSDQEFFYDSKGQPAANPSASPSPGATPAAPATQGGIYGTPTMFVNGVQFTLDQLFTNNGTSIVPQVITDAPNMLLFLQSIVNQ